jgi:hypothetical protein
MSNHRRILFNKKFKFTRLTISLLSYIINKVKEANSVNNKKTTQPTPNEATAQKTKNPFKPILIIIVILLIIGTILFIAYKTNTEVRKSLNHIYYSQIYSGNRNIGTVSITIDGQPYKLETADFSMKTEDTLMNGCEFDKIIINNDGSAEVQIVAGEKTMYIYYIDVDNIEQPIPFRFMHMAQWYYSEYELSVNIDTKNHTCTYDGYYILNGFKTDVNITADYCESLDRIGIIPSG